MLRRRGKLVVNHIAIPETCASHAEHSEQPGSSGGLCSLAKRIKTWLDKRHYGSSLQQLSSHTIHHASAQHALTILVDHQNCVQECGKIVC